MKQDTRSNLAYAPDGERFAVVLFFKQNLAKEKVERTGRWVRQVIDYVTKRGGTYYLPYQHFATNEQFQAAYPKWRSLAKLKRNTTRKGFFKTVFTKTISLKRIHHGYRFDSII